MLNWLKNLGRAAQPNASASKSAILEQLWLDTMLQYPFLARRPVADLQQLRGLVERFLKRKEFTGVNGLVVTDAMAVAIAAQACLPVLHLGLRWYDGFTGIVVHPGPMVAQREVTDHTGVVHRYREVLQGEAMQDGPVTLSWEHVEAAGASAEGGHNLVIHEFVHKIDMRDGEADGCPPLATRRSQSDWHETMQPAYDAFCEKVAMAQRFGAEAPWLDAYGATSPAEFFAVTSEAYFVNRERFTLEFPALTVLFDKFFLVRRT